MSYFWGQNYLVYGLNILVAFFRGNRTFYFSHSLALDLPEQDGEQKQAR